METILPLRPRETPAVARRAPIVDPRRLERIARLASRLAQSIADAADADQADISIDGVTSPDPTLPAPLIPREWLIALNNGRSGLYRISIRLRADGRQFGTLRLATIRPCGFQAEDIARAQMDAFHASEMLATALDCATLATREPFADSVVDFGSFREQRTRQDAAAALAS